MAMLLCRDAFTREKINERDGLQLLGRHRFSPSEHRPLMGEVKNLSFRTLRALYSILSWTETRLLRNAGASD